MFGLLCPVHVRQKVHDPYRREQEEVDFPDKLLLFLWSPSQVASFLNVFCGLLEVDRLQGGAS
jgi:hypothetical protein